MESLAKDNVIFFFFFLAAWLLLTQNTIIET